MAARQSPSATQVEQCRFPGNSLLPLSIHFYHFQPRSSVAESFLSLVESASLTNDSELLYNNMTFLTIMIIHQIGSRKNLLLTNDNISFMCSGFGFSENWYLVLNVAASIYQRYSTFKGLEFNLKNNLTKNNVFS